MLIVSVKGFSVLILGVYKVIGFFSTDKVAVCMHLCCGQGYSTVCSYLVQTRLQFAHLCCGQGYSLLIFGVYKVTVCSPLV